VRVTRFFATAAGGSAFEEVDLAFPLARDDDFGHTLRTTHPFEPSSAVFVELPAGLNQGWHNAPDRQLVQVLDGEIEVETTDGETRRWRNGEVFMADDVDGKGHLTRVIGGPARLLFVVVPADFSLGALG
jgi:hypothetical protein